MVSWVTRKLEKKKKVWWNKSNGGQLMSYEEYKTLKRPMRSLNKKIKKLHPEEFEKLVLKSKALNICKICNKIGQMTKHHLIPTSVSYKYPRYTTKNTIFLCVACHSDIHRLFTNEELAKNFGNKKSFLNIVNELIFDDERADYVKLIEKGNIPSNPLTFTEPLMVATGP